jgi:hypothetical protein
MTMGPSRFLMNHWPRIKEVFGANHVQDIHHLSKRVLLLGAGAGLINLSRGGSGGQICASGLSLRMATICAASDASGRSKTRVPRPEAANRDIKLGTNGLALCDCSRVVAQYGYSANSVDRRWRRYLSAIRSKASNRQYPPYT